MYISLLIAPRSLWTEKGILIKRGFSVNYEHLFLIAVNREWKNIFLVIREITILFLEIREQGL